MNARELYEQFDEWLWAKYRECCREWHQSTDDEVRARYDRLLAQICHDITWLSSKLK